MKNIDKITALILASVLLFGCSSDSETLPSESTAETTTTAASVETTTETTVETTEDRGHFEFKPIVMSSIFRDIMGEDMVQAYCNYVHAVMAREDSFEVKSEHDYDWMIGQFPSQFHPLYRKYTESNYGGAFKDGRGTFSYKIPKDELTAKEEEFEELCAFLREFRIERAGVFPFSPEEGTQAAEMEHVGEDEARRLAFMENK